jgi:hypothetical protein
MTNMLGTAANALAVAPFEMTNMLGTAANALAVAPFEMTNMSGKIEAVLTVGVLVVAKFVGTTGWDAFAVSVV